MQWKNKPLVCELPPAHGGIFGERVFGQSDFTVSVAAAAPGILLDGFAC